MSDFPDRFSDTGSVDLVSDETEAAKFQDALAFDWTHTSGAFTQLSPLPFSMPIPDHIGSSEADAAIVEAYGSFLRGAIQGEFTDDPNAFETLGQIYSDIVAAPVTSVRDIVGGESGSSKRKIAATRCGAPPRSP